MANWSIYTAEAIDYDYIHDLGNGTFYFDSNEGGTYPVTYTITYTDDNGCQASYDMTVPMCGEKEKKCNDYGYLTFDFVNQKISSSQYYTTIPSSVWRVGDVNSGTMTVEPYDQSTRDKVTAVTATLSVEYHAPYYNGSMWGVDCDGNFRGCTGGTSGDCSSNSGSLYHVYADGLSLQKDGNTINTCSVTTDGKKVIVSYNFRNFGSLVNDCCYSDEIRIIPSFIIGMAFYYNDGSSCHHECALQLAS